MRVSSVPERGEERTEVDAARAGANGAVTPAEAQATARHHHIRLDLDDDGVEAMVSEAVATWPEIDPDVEAVVERVGKIDRLLNKAAKASLSKVDLGFEEFKVLMNLYFGPQSHGTLSRSLLVSTGAMTNRLDKLEQAGLVKRERDPSDRRGVLLEITDAGRERLDTYAAIGGRRERELLAVLSRDELQALNVLLKKVLGSLQAQLGPPPRRSPAEHA